MHFSSPPNILFITLTKLFEGLGESGKFRNEMLWEKIRSSYYWNDVF
jgi:hypothetical protein